MARINLLPWREERRKENKQKFLIAIATGAIAGLAVVALTHWYFVKLIDHQKSRNEYIQTETALLDSKIKEIKDLEKERDRLIARMNAIEKLQTSRPVVVHLFDELVSHLPEGVYLTQVGQKGSGITIKGIARSNARVSNFIRNLESSQWLQNADLDIIQTKEVEGKRINDFTLKVQQSSPQRGESEEEA